MAQPWLWREEGSQPLFPLSGSGLCQGGTVLSLALRRQLNRARQRSSEPSWAAVGTLGQLSFHPHQSLPTPRFSPHLNVAPASHLVFGLLGWTLSRELGWRPRVLTFSLGGSQCQESQTTRPGGELLQAGACTLNLGLRIQTLSPGARSLGSPNLQWGIPELRTSTRSLEPQCGGRLETGLTEFLWWLGAHPRSSWLGQVLLCPSLRSSGWIPDGLASRQGQAWDAEPSTPSTRGQGCLSLSAFQLSTLSLRACSALRSHMGSSSACGQCLWLPRSSSSSCQSAFPKAQPQGDLRFLCLWVQEPRRNRVEGSVAVPLSSSLWGLAGVGLLC